MALFIDTSRVEEIERAMKMGIIRGVTTNPIILMKDKESNKPFSLKDRIIEIARVVSPYPVSVEVTSNEPVIMFDQAREFSSWAENIIIKIPVHGPNGELENIEVAHLLEKKYNIRVNLTAMMSAQQCLIGALARASYVSLFGGRINNIGYDAREEIRKARLVLDDQHLPSKIIVGSTREILNVIEWLEAGAHFVTVLPELLWGMIRHPYTRETVQTFLEQAQKLEEKK